MNLPSASPDATAPTYPDCTDVPDRPLVHSYCSLWGPTFNADIEVKFWIGTEVLPYDVAQRRVHTTGELAVNESTSSRVHGVMPGA